MADGTHLVFQPAERSATFWIRALVGTGEDLVLELRGRGGAHWGGIRKWRGKRGGGTGRMRWGSETKGNYLRTSVGLGIGSNWPGLE